MQWAVRDGAQPHTARLGHPLFWLGWENARGYGMAALLPAHVSVPILLHG